MLLADTSVWIDYFNSFRSAEAAYLAVSITEARKIVIPGLVLTEVLLGVRDAAGAERIREPLLAFNLAPDLDRADYESAAAVYRDCRSRGTTLRSTIDCLIAQLCLRYDYELLTRDRDFEAIAAVRPLRLAVPPPQVHERAARYGLARTSIGAALAAATCAPAAASRAPAAPVDETIERRPVTRQRASAPRRSSRASAPRSRATPR